jgi:hypothetical protein
MNKLWISMALIMVLMTVVACGGGAESDSVADVAASSAQEITASAPGYDSRTPGKAPLHPDVVHGLVPSTSNLSPSPEGAKSPLHPDVVHGLVRPPFQIDLAADRRSTGD